MQEATILKTKERLFNYEQELNALYVRLAELEQQRAAEKRLLKQDKIDVQHRRCTRQINKATTNILKIKNRLYKGRT